MNGGKHPKFAGRRIRQQNYVAELNAVLGTTDALAYCRGLRHFRLMSQPRNQERGGQRRKPAPLSDDRLRQAAYRYLERFAATEATLLRALDNRIRRTLGPDADAAELDRWRLAAQAIAHNCVELGLVDDRAFAVAKARRLHERGKPAGEISRALAHKGVGDEDREGALHALAEEKGGALDLRAAAAYARRRRLGPFAAPAAQTPEARRKVQAMFARAGFSYAVARAVLAAADEEALDELIRSADADRP